MPEEKPLSAEYRTNKLNTQIVSTPESNLGHNSNQTHQGELAGGHSSTY